MYFYQLQELRDRKKRLPACETIPVIMESPPIAVQFVKAIPMLDIVSKTT
jgi:hypothetical protein